MFTVAPTEAKLTRSWFGPAPVFRLKFVAVRVRNDPTLICSVSTLKTNAWTLPAASNVTVARSASLPASVLSLMRPLTGLPGRKVTPPEAK
jgi:hypothetical protein